MGFNIRGGDKSSLALLSSKKGKAYAKSRADEAFALPAFPDVAPAPTIPQRRPQANGPARHQSSEHDAENVKQTMLQHESMFKEQLHELHRLYQKQCMLMAESSSGPPPDREPEPPSSNSSLLCNFKAGELQEESSLGNSSCSKICDSARSFRTLLDGKHLENHFLSGKQSSQQLADGCHLNRKHGKRPLFDLEQPAVKDPMIDLERPADEHHQTDVQEEKPEIPISLIKAENIANSGHSPHSGSSNAGGKTEVPAGASGGLQCKKLFGFHINTTTASESTAGANRETQKGFLEQKLLVSNHAESMASRDNKLFGFNIIDPNHQRRREELSDSCFVAKVPATNHPHSFSKGSVMTSTRAEEEPLLYPKRSFSTSEPFQGLPDLNCDVDITDKQVPPLQALLQENVKERHFEDLKANSRPDTSISKLPHWLCQAPPARPLPLHGSLQIPVSQTKSSVFFPKAFDQTLKSSLFLSQLHDETNELYRLPVATTKVSAMHVQDPSRPGSQSSMLNFDRREAFLREVANASSTQLSRGSTVGTPEHAYPGIFNREFVNRDVPHYSSQVRENDRMAMLPLPSLNLTPLIVGSQSYGFEREGSSIGFAPKVSSENYSSISHWNQQTESFASLLQQASNSEPFGKKSCPATSISPWDTNSSYEGPPYLGTDHRDRPVLQSDARNTESSLQPKSKTLRHMFDGPGFVGPFRSKQDREYTMCKQLEIPFLTAKRQQISSDNHLCDLNATKLCFDLNVSSEDYVDKGCFDACNIMDISYNMDQPQSFKPESGMSRSSGWGSVDAIEAPFIHQQQKESGSMTVASVAKGEPMTILSDTDVLHLHKDASFMKKSEDNDYLEGDMLRDEICADYCSGEDETGGGYVEAKSSDGSGLTSCESRDGVHLQHVKARDDSNSSGGEACYSLESKIFNCNEDMGFSSSLQQKVLSSHVTGVYNSLLLQDVQATSSQGDTKEDFLLCNEFADESEAANVVHKKDLVEASEVAEILFSLGLDLPPIVGDEESFYNCSRNCLDWLADIIPREDCNQEMDVEITDPIEQSQETNTNKTLDTFELAVLELKPVDPDLEYIPIQPPYRGHGVEVIPMLRRRPSRRGRAGKDFQREMLRSISALSRNEVTEDLQIIEGLIKSAAETTNSCSTSSERPPSSSGQMPFRSFVKVKSTLSSKGRTLNESLNVCSWGDTMRRKRMGRQRSQWLSLPPGVRISLFQNDAVNLTF